MNKIEINAMGDKCPIPVVKTIKALGALTGPAELEVSVDNEIAVQNLTKLAAGKGLPVRSEKVGEGRFSVYITAEAPVAVPQAEETCCVPDVRGNVIVAFDSDAMGRGDDELGKTLMKGFIYALSQQEKLPAAMLFYNGGARLTTEGSVSLEDLKSMEAQGVEILTCGTCLNYYGITEKLAVGSVTNMYAIVEKLCAADKVIKP